MSFEITLIILGWIATLMIALNFHSRLANEKAIRESLQKELEHERKKMSLLHK